MALASTLYRFRIDLSDIDRGVYNTLNLRVAMHPSESPAFLITRVLAYALHTQEGLQFSKEGLGTPEEPCISVTDPGGGHTLWIEIGNPSAKKLHRATKSSPSVKVYTYKNPQILIDDLRAAKIYQPERLELFSFPDAFLNRLEELLSRDNTWNIVRNEGQLMVNVGEEPVEGEAIQHSLQHLFKN